jgi:hypothetical protein
MVSAGKDAFLAAGLPVNHLHYDSFEFAADTHPAPRSG